MPININGLSLGAHLVAVHLVGHGRSAFHGYLGGFVACFFRALLHVLTDFLCFFPDFLSGGAVLLGGGLERKSQRHHHGSCCKYFFHGMRFGQRLQRLYHRPASTLSPIFGGWGFFFLSHRNPFLQLHVKRHLSDTDDPAFVA